jgi:hypothetical protein
MDYTWAPAFGLSDPLIAQPWFTGLLTGTYNLSLVVVDMSTVAACSDTASVTVTVVDTPQVALTAVGDTICLGNSSMISAIPSGGLLPYSYAWSNAQTTASQAVTPTTTTTYTATITDASNCRTSGNVTVVRQRYCYVNAFGDA